jgi:gas vesicle protein
MSVQTTPHRNYRFVIGLAAGTVVGAGLATWLVPRAASELRQRATDTAQRLGTGAAGRYQRASARAGAVVEGLTRAGQDVRDGLADAVAQGAHAVERYASAARTDGAAGAGGTAAPIAQSASRHAD